MRAVVLLSLCLTSLGHVLPMTKVIIDGAELKHIEASRPLEALASLFIAIQCPAACWQIAQHGSSNARTYFGRQRISMERHNSKCRMGQSTAEQMCKGFEERQALRGVDRRRAIRTAAGSALFAMLSQDRAWAAGKAPTIGKPTIGTKGSSASAEAALGDSSGLGQRQFDVSTSNVTLPTALDDSRRLNTRIRERKFKMTRQEVEKKLGNIPCAILVDKNGGPYLTVKEEGAYVYLEPESAREALKKLQETEPTATIKILTVKDLYFDFIREPESPDTDFRILPTRLAVREANNKMDQDSANKLYRDEGDVPIFYSNEVIFVNDNVTTYPIFFAKKDLDEAYIQITKPDCEAGKTSCRQMDTAGVGIPKELMNVVTLDQLVSEMLLGESNLNSARFVRDSSDLEAWKNLYKEYKK